MKHLTEYILEALLYESEDKVDDKKVAKMQKKILELLIQKEGNLSNFVNQLNKILLSANKQDNSKEWLLAIKALFDGDKENIKANIDTIDFEDPKYGSIPVSKLFPTQSEIDIQNSIKHWVAHPENLPNIWKDKDFGHNFGVPVLVYTTDGSKYWIIDGHHRWSQVALLNPEGAVHCMLMKGKMSPIQFLELTQSAIAAVIANPNNKNNGVDGKLKQGKAVEENNIFGKNLKDNEAFKKKITEIIGDQKDAVVKYIPDEVKKDNKDFNFDSVLDLMVNNREIMIKKGQVPPKNAAPRPVMPQSDSAAPEGEKGKPAPDNEGSALNYIAKGNFPNFKS